MMEIAIDMAKKALDDRIDEVRKKYTATIPADPNEKAKNEADLESVRSIVNLQKNSQHNKSNDPGPWKAIRFNILSLQVRLSLQEASINNDPALFLHSLNTLKEQIDLGFEYLKSLDETLESSKSKQRINFLSEQALSQPVKTMKNNKDGLETNSYYLEKSSSEKVMNLLMKHGRGLGKQSSVNQCTIKEMIVPDRNDQSKKTDIFYPMDHVIKRQTTFYNCSDTCSAMINHFQKLELPERLKKLRELRAQASDKKEDPQFERINQLLNLHIHILETASNKFNQTYHVAQGKDPIKHRSFRNDTELQDLYSVNGSIRHIEYTKARDNVEAREKFTKQLSKCLYEVGPLSALINVGSPVNNHMVVINGVVDDKICYVDPWYGQCKEMPVEVFVKKMRHSDLSGIHGFSYAVLDDINTLEKQIKQAPASGPSSEPKKVATEEATEEGLRGNSL